MHQHSELLKRTCLGAAGGLLGTLAVQGLMAATKKWLPAAMPPMRQEPGEFMVEQAERVLPDRIRRHVPETVEAVAATGLGVGYGLTFGALYGALAPRGGSPLAGGAALGLGCWAAGYLGWLPALGLMPPVGEQSAAEVAGPVVHHLAFGVVTATAYNWLCGEFNPSVPVEAEFGGAPRPEPADTRV